MFRVCYGVVHPLGEARLRGYATAMASTQKARQEALREAQALRALILAALGAALLLAWHFSRLAQTGSLIATLFVVTALVYGAWWAHQQTQAATIAAQPRATKRRAKPRNAQPAAAASASAPASADDNPAPAQDTAPPARRRPRKAAAASQARS